MATLTVTLHPVRTDTRKNRKKPAKSCKILEKIRKNRSKALKSMKKALTSSIFGHFHARFTHLLTSF